VSTATYFFVDLACIVPVIQQIVPAELEIFKISG